MRRSWVPDARASLLGWRVCAPTPGFTSYWLPNPGLMRAGWALYPAPRLDRGRAAAICRQVTLKPAQWISVYSGFLQGHLLPQKTGDRDPSQRHLWDWVPPCTQERPFAITVPCRLLGLGSLRFLHPPPCLFPQTLCPTDGEQRRTCDVMECQNMW